MSTTDQPAPPGATAADTAPPAPPGSTAPHTGTPTRTAPARRAGTWATLRPLVLRIHFYAGVFVAPFLAVAALTGLVYVFSPQLSDAVYAEQVFAAVPDAPARALDEQVAAATAAVGAEGTLASVVVPAHPARTTEVVFDVPGLAEDWQRTVYVEPSTGQVRGQLDTWFGYPPLQATLDGLHRHLLLGEPGRLYSEAAASWLWVLVLGGLALWLTDRRARRRAATLVLPSRDARPGRGRLKGWHGAAGMWLAVGLLFLSATGLTWSTHAGERFTALLTALDGRSPQLGAETVAVQDGRPTITLDDAVARGRAAGLADELAVTVPAGPGAVFVVAENVDTWPVQRDRVALDPYTGATVESIAWADYPAPAKLTTIGVLAHMGLLWGLPNQLALAALALGLLSVLFWGYRMAWLRRPTGRSVPSAPGRRGTLRELPAPVALAVVVGTVAVCWAVPVLGVTLMAFLVLDAVLHRRRRPDRDRPVPEAVSQDGRT